MAKHTLVTWKLSVIQCQNYYRWCSEPTTVHTQLLVDRGE